MDDKKIQEIFASNINKLRKSKSLTQSDLAKILGVGVSTVSDWEKAKNTLVLVLSKNYLNTLAYRKVIFSKFKEALQISTKTN
nr:helix-turn-helix transcriptional regulator [Paenibacillus larvae]